MVDQNQCKFLIGPGVRCQMVDGHDKPYYPYLDYGQTGEYSDILRQGSNHKVEYPAPKLPPREEWTGDEQKDCPRNNTFPIFKDRLSEKIDIGFDIDNILQEEIRKSVEAKENYIRWYMEVHNLDIETLARDYIMESVEDFTDIDFDIDRNDYKYVMTEVYRLRKKRPEEMEKTDAAESGVRKDHDPLGDV